MIITKDAYTELFKNIDKKSFFDFGIKDIIYIEDKVINDEWEKLKNDVFNNQTIYIRGYGRDGLGTDLYKKFYEKLFCNSKLVKDSSNNYYPTKLLENLTSFSKKNKKDSVLIKNYQISHLFGRTKNPLLFNCPWNVAYIPKYLDPFTGHETQGEFSIEFKELITPIIKSKFKIYIDDYNSIYRDCIADKIDESLDYVKKYSKEINLSDKKFKRFENDVKNELREI
jgi:hypothetical protein